VKLVCLALSSAAIVLQIETSSLNVSLILCLTEANFWEKCASIVSEATVIFHAQLIVFFMLSVFSSLSDLFADSEFYFTSIRFVISIIKSEKSSKKFNHKKFAESA